jgi:hypothetical protein
MGKATRRKTITLRRAKPEADPVLIGYDGQPPMFRDARDIGGHQARERVKGPQNINVDRLEWLLAHKLIEPHHHQAGRKLQDCCQIAELSVGVALAGGGGGGSPSTALSDAKCDAMTAINKARAALSPMAWRMIELVVIDGVTVGKAAARMRIAERAGLPALLFSLDALGRHYSLC